jgi:hypothetical protein
VLPVGLKLRRHQLQQPNNITTFNKAYKKECKISDPFQQKTTITNEGPWYFFKKSMGGSLEVF